MTNQIIRDQQSDTRLREELASFQGLWPGGYCNQVRAPGKRNLPGVLTRCVEPYASGATVLEIGPGRGAWTKEILASNPAKVYCLDALSAKHNDFWSYLGREASHVVDYFQVTDFTCEMIPNESVDFLFSFDTFCHISLTGIEEYLKHLRPKLKKGANCFIMLADAQKYRRVSSGNGFVRPNDGIDELSYNGPPSPGRWYWVGIDRFCNMLDKYGYQILRRDVDVDPRDPICHFTVRDDERANLCFEVIASL